MFLIYPYLLLLATAAIHNFPTAIITIDTTSSALISGTPGDQCDMLIVKNSQLHHVSKENIYQNRPKGSLGTVSASSVVVTGGITNSFDVNDNETFVYFGTDVPTYARLIFSLNSDFTYASGTPYYST